MYVCNLILLLYHTENSNTYHEIKIDKIDKDQSYGSQVVNEIIRKPGKN